MPATKDAMTRYRILDELLSSKYKQYSLDDLTEEVNKKLCEIDSSSDGVTRRCIEKDLYYLKNESPFDIEIEPFSVQSYNRNTGKNYTKRCLKYTDDSCPIFNTKLNNDEEYLLKEAFSLLGHFEGLPEFGALEKFRNKVNTNRCQKQIISLTKNSVENTSFIGQLYSAINQRQVIELQYHSFGQENMIKKCNVYPYLLKEYNRRWYLIAAFFNNMKLLCFALDRIDLVTPLPSYSYIDYPKDVTKHFKNIIGVTLPDNEDVQHIVFWVSENSVDYVRSKNIHDSQVEIDDEVAVEIRKQHGLNKTGGLFSIDCIRNYELIRELCSFGPELIVLLPKIIQDEIRQRIIKMKEVYEKY